MTTPTDEEIIERLGESLHGISEDIDTETIVRRSRRRRARVAGIAGSAVAVCAVVATAAASSVLSADHLHSTPPVASQVPMPSVPTATQDRVTYSFPTDDAHRLDHRPGYSTTTGPNRGTPSCGRIASGEAADLPATVLRARVGQRVEITNWFEASSVHVPGSTAALIIGNVGGSYTTHMTLTDPGKAPAPTYGGRVAARTHIFRSPDERVSTTVGFTPSKPGRYPVGTFMRFDCRLSDGSTNGTMYEQVPLGYIVVAAAAQQAHGRGWIGPAPVTCAELNVVAKAIGPHAVIARTTVGRPTTVTATLVPATKRGQASIQRAYMFVQPPGTFAGTDNWGSSNLAITRLEGGSGIPLRGQQLVVRFTPHAPGTYPVNAWYQASCSTGGDSGGAQTVGDIVVS